MQEKKEAPEYGASFFDGEGLLIIAFLPHHNFD